MLSLDERITCSLIKNNLNILINPPRMSYAENAKREILRALRSYIVKPTKDDPPDLRRPPLLPGAQRNLYGTCRKAAPSPPWDRGQCIYIEPQIEASIEDFCGFAEKPCTSSLSRLFLPTLRDRTRDRNPKKLLWVLMRHRPLRPNRTNRSFARLRKPNPTHVSMQPLSTSYLLLPMTGGTDYRHSCPNAALLQRRWTPSPTIANLPRAEMDL